MNAVAVHHDVYAVPGLPADAPTVLLSNSLGSTYAMWDQQLGALSRHFRIIRYDARGHGDSPVPPGPYAIDDLADDVSRCSTGSTWSAFISSGCLSAG